MPVVRISNPDDRRLDLYRRLNRVNLVRESGRFIAEGKFVVERLIASRFPVESVLITEERYRKLGEMLPEDEANVYVVPRSIVEPLVGFDFHSGILACGLRRPPDDLQAVMQDAPERLTLAVCPKTTDPVNVGNIVRLCSGFGVRALLLGPGCADPFSRRALRISMGNAFRLPIVESNDLAADLTWLKDSCGVELAAMLLADDAESLQRVVPPVRTAVLFGHESAGLDEEWMRLCDHRWTIPMAPGADSLNVATAAAIALYHLTRMV